MLLPEQGLIYIKNYILTDSTSQEIYFLSFINPGDQIAGIQITRSFAAPCLLFHRH
jgi:hypothetical protein